MPSQFVPVSIVHFNFSSVSSFLILISTVSRIFVFNVFSVSPPTLSKKLSGASSDVFMSDKLSDKKHHPGT